MSYDLQFFKAQDSLLAKSEIEHHLSEIPHISQEDENEWVYQNPETGVYCVFSFNEFEEGEEGIEGFDNTNLSFSINFIRPDFFGKESFPIVDQLSETLDLFVLDSQSDGVPKKYEKGHFESEWSKANSNFAKHFSKESEVGILAREKSEYYWKYLSNRAELQAKLGEEYFVPKIFFLQNRDTQVVETFCVWPQHIPIVLPEVDYVVIQRKRRKLFFSKAEDGVVKYSEIMSSLGSFFKSESNYKILEPGQRQNLWRNIE